MNKTKMFSLGVAFSLVAGQATYSYNLHRENVNLKKNIELLHRENKALQEKLSKSEQTLNELDENLKETMDLLDKTQKELDEKSKKLKDLTGKVFYNPNDLTKKSHATVSQLEKALAGTALSHLAPTFVEAEKTYGVNALFLIGLVANESAWGTSSRAKYDNNMTGYAVYTSASRGGVFNSKHESIMLTAKLLREHYLDENGTYYNGKSLWAVNRRYSREGNSTNTHWSKTINSIAQDLKSKINK